MQENPPISGLLAMGTILIIFKHARYLRVKIWILSKVTAANQREADIAAKQH